jgi:flagellar biosynthetic protein FlhB
MAEHDQDQKTEQPTAKRMSEAASRGDFSRTPEITVVMSLAAAFAVLSLTAQPTVEGLADYSVYMFSNFYKITLDAGSLQPLLLEAIRVVAHGVAPILLACAGAAMLAGGLQSGFQLAPEAVSLRWSALNPTAGFEKIFSKSTLVRSGIDFLKVLAVGYGLYLAARGLMEDPIFSAPVDVAYIGIFLREASASFMLRLLLSLSAIAAVSYGWEKFQKMKSQMMTRQEVKDEQKNSEGDQNVKGARRRMARRLIQKQMLSAVPTADVVVTNPTHYAVALKYERGRDAAPVVLAKGENRFALRIKELAKEHGVPTVENRPVARVLFSLGKVGETIPPQLYQAVAEILAVVYRTHRYYFHQLKARRLEVAR